MSGVDTKSTKGVMERLLGSIERAGDKVPHPAVIFLLLCGLVIVLSHVLFLFDVSVTYDVIKPGPVDAEVVERGGSHENYYEVPAGPADTDDYEPTTETTEIESLLTGDGIRFIFTSSVQNFTNFGVVGVILVAMVGVGVAEEAGLITALIRKLVIVAPAKAITFIIVLLGVVSSVAPMPVTWSSYPWGRRLSFRLAVTRWLGSPPPMPGWPPDSASTC